MHALGVTELSRSPGYLLPKPAGAQKMSESTEVGINTAPQRHLCDRIAERSQTNNR